jgi:exopolysaccharide production protein ExoY
MVHRSWGTLVSQASQKRAPTSAVKSKLVTSTRAERGRAGAQRVAQSEIAGDLRKRATDIVIAAAALVFLFPVLITIALLVKLHDGGPVLFGHARVGLGGRSFKMLKFRSMCMDGDRVLREYLANNPAADEEWRAERKLKNDPRVTALGRFLRASSLDELPQLLNVLSGEMSLVGPRPVPETEWSAYTDAREYYVLVRPGITGLWQVSGRNRLSYRERLSLDQRYVVNWSFSGDFVILLRTVPTVLGGVGAY